VRERKQITIYILLLLPLLLLNFPQASSIFKNIYLLTVSPLVSGVDYLINHSERVLKYIWIEDDLLVEKEWVQQQFTGKNERRSKSPSPYLCTNYFFWSFIPF